MNWFAELAAARLSGGTRSGMAALIAGMKKARTMPPRSATAKSPARRTGCALEKNMRAARPRVPIPESRSQTTRMRTREWRSAKVPPKGVRRTPGMEETVISRPMRLAEPVVFMSQNIIATENAWSPRRLTVCPCQRRKKLRFQSRPAGGVAGPGAAAAVTGAGAAAPPVPGPAGSPAAPSAAGIAGEASIRRPPAARRS